MSICLLILVAVTAPRVVGGHSYSVLSDSMRGAVDVGDQVIVMPIQGMDIRVGQIVAFEDQSRDGMLLQHRVVDVEHRDAETTVTTRGDSNTANETWRVPADGSVGEVVAVIPKLGYVLGRASDPGVRLALILIGVLCVGALSITAIWSGRGRGVAVAALVGWLVLLGAGLGAEGAINGALSSSSVNAGNEFAAAEDFGGG